MTTICENLNKVRNIVSIAEKRYNRPAGAVTIVAISKMQAIEKIKEAVAYGQYHFGENYLQEALPKIRALTNPNIIWHYTGTIQSRKTKLIATNFSWVETITSYTSAELLNCYRPPTLPPLNVCIQVNISHELTKNGITYGELLPLAKKIIKLPRIKLRGLMTVPEPASKFTQQLKPFNDLFLEYDQLKMHGFPLDTLSMGMSNDFVAAIAAGATSIRIGTAIFGPRPPSDKIKR